MAKSEPTEVATQPRTLTVKGRGLVSAESDLVVLFFRVSGRDPAYAEAVEKLNSRVEALRNELETMSITRKQLKSTDFSVHTDYDYEKGKRAFLDYVASHSLKLELPFDKDLLNRVLGQIALGASETTVKISFDVSDKETLRRRAMGAAVADARASAQVLADAASLALGEIVRIDYGFVEVRVRSHLRSYEMADAMADVSPPDIEPEALDAEESVTIVWEIT